MSGMEGSRSLSGAAGSDRFMRQNPSEILAFLGSKSGQVTPPPPGVAPTGGRGLAPFDPLEFPSLGRSTSNLGGGNSMLLGSHSSLPVSVGSTTVGNLPHSNRALPSVSEGLYSENFPALPHTRGNAFGSSGPISHSGQPSVPSNPFTQAVQQQQQLQHGQANSSRHDLALAGSFGLMGLMGVIRMEDPDRGSLALGTDLTTLGLNLNSSESLHTIFSGPWDDVQKDALFSLPPSYPKRASVRPEVLEKVSLETLFVAFYSMTRDVLQVLAAQELVNRGWKFHEDLRLWFLQTNNGSVVYFDVHAWDRRIFSGRLPEGFESGFLSSETIGNASRLALAQLQQQNRSASTNPAGTTGTW